jgi:peptidoglycan/LPS O-acetylase OafA/YrhL
MTHHRHSILAEATDAGFLGGTAVAVLFLVRDLIKLKPLLTPSILGQVILFGASVPDTSRIDFAAVVLYTPVHFLVFLAFGFLSTVLVRLAARQPAVLMALVLLFVIFEVAFYVFIDAVSSELRGYFPLALVLLANLVAAIVMGIYFWRRYPELGRALRRDPLGA